jgi:hypothetical protein
VRKSRSGTAQEWGALPEALDLLIYSLLLFEGWFVFNQDFALFFISFKSKHPGKKTVFACVVTRMCCSHQLEAKFGFPVN